MTDQAQFGLVSSLAVSNILHLLTKDGALIGKEAAYINFLYGALCTLLQLCTASSWLTALQYSIVTCGVQLLHGFCVGVVGYQPFERRKLQ